MYSIMCENTENGLTCEQCRKEISRGLGRKREVFKGLLSERGEKGIKSRSVANYESNRLLLVINL